MEKEFSKTPWMQMWVNPRKTVRKIIQENPKKGFIILSFIYGFPWILHFAQSFLLGKTYSFGAILLGALILAIPYGYVSLSILTLLFLWTGKIIKGKADYYSLRAAVSWAKVPFFLSIVIWLISMVIVGNALFNLTALTEGNSIVRFIQLSAFAQLVLSIWSLIILIFAVSEAQRFSFWMGLLNAILGFIFYTIVLFLLSWIVSAFGR